MTSSPLPPTIIVQELADGVRFRLPQRRWGNALISVAFVGAIAIGISLMSSFSFAATILCALFTGGIAFMALLVIFGRCVIDVHHDAIISRDTLGLAWRSRMALLDEIDSLNLSA